jgi:hypothetical protein
VVRGLLGLIVPEGQREAAKDLEIVVLRHQLKFSVDRLNGPTFAFPIGYFSPPRLDDCHGFVASVSS